MTLERDIINQERDLRNQEADAKRRKQIQRAQARLEKTQTQENSESKGFTKNTLGYYSSVHQTWENITDAEDEFELLPGLSHETSLALPVHSRRLRTPSSSFQVLWEHIFCADAFQLITVATQNNMNQNLNKHGLPKFEPLKSDAIERFLLAQMEMRSQYSNLTADSYFNGTDIKQNSLRAEICSYRRWGLSNNLFWRIASNIAVDFGELSDILSARLLSWVRIIGNIVIDESVIACQGRDAPTVYLPRKPHPEGLRLYLLCVKLAHSGKTFPIKIVPDFEPNSSIRVTELLSNVFGPLRDMPVVRRNPPLVTMDAFFGVEQLLIDPPNPMKVLVSWNKGRHKNLWNELFYGLHPKQFRVARNGDNFVASAFRDNGDMSVITNAIQVKKSPSPNQTTSTSPGESNNAIDPPESSLVDNTIHEEPIISAPALGSPILCRSCHRPGIIATSGRGAAIKCHSCEFGIHISCNPPSSPLPEYKFCSRGCRSDFFCSLARLEEEDDLDDNPPVELSQLSEDTIKVLSKLPKKHLALMCKHFNCSTLDNTQQGMAYSLGGYLEIPATSVSSSSLTTSSTSAFSISSSSSDVSSEASPSLRLNNVSPPPSSSSGDVPQVPDALDVTPRSNGSRSYTEMGNTALKRIVSSCGLKPKGDRAQLINQATLCEMNQEERKSLTEAQAEWRQQTGTVDSHSKPFIHQLYADTFNAVDTFDKRFYELFRLRKTLNWKETALIGLGYYVILSMHSISEEWSRSRFLPNNGPSSSDTRSFASSFFTSIKLSKFHLNSPS